jgi:hypothetical protein
VSNIYPKKHVQTSPTQVMPAQVLVSLGEIAESAKEGLLALAVGAGLQVMYAMMDADVIALVEPKGKHNPDRAAVRHGHEGRSVTRPILAVLDGAKALSKAVRQVFDKPIIQRCHNIR